MRTLNAILLSILITTGLSAQLANRDYGDLLTQSVRFFEAQDCGPDVSNHSTFSWRGNCHESDGSTVGLDLTGGWHDAGDHVKFNFPLAFAVYTLGSLYVDYRPQLDQLGKRDVLLKQLRFVGDYMIRCHPDPDRYVIQVGDGQLDHQFWQIPEQNNYRRNAYFIEPGKPGTDLACATAAGFAVLSMAFEGVDDAYSSELLQHARDLYQFGRDNLGYFSDHIPTAEAKFYGSNRAEKSQPQAIAIGGIWLYRATGEDRYLIEAEQAANSLTYIGGWAPTFGNDDFEAILQLAKVTGKQVYLDRAARYAVALANGSEGRRSPGGLYYPDNKEDLGFSLPLALGTAQFAYRYAELVGPDNPNYTSTRDYAFRQFNYVLGDNPRGRSYVVGYGNNPPRRTHHRSAHGPNGTAIDTNPLDDSNELTGGLVMGPIGLDDSYNNTRSIIKFTEPAVGNNAVLALSAALMLKETGRINPPTVNEIRNLQAPSSFSPGSTVRVSVDYEATGDRDVIAVLQRDGNPDYQGFAPLIRTQITRGRGSLTFNLRANDNTPVRRDDYQVNVFMTRRGENWSQRFDSKVRINMDCTSADPSSGSTDRYVYRDNLNPGWQDWSWGGNTRVRDSGIKRVGTHSFKLQAQNGGAVSMRHDVGFTATDLRNITFWARSWSTDYTSTLQARWDDNDGNPGKTYSVTPAWRQVSIPSADLGTGWIKRLVWTVPQDRTIFLDDVRLVYNSGSNARISQEVRVGKTEADTDRLVDMQVFPIPNRGIFTVDLYLPVEEAEVTLQLLDISGRAVEQTKITGFAGQNRLHLDYREAHLPTGVYLLRASSADTDLNLVRKVSIR